MQHDKTRSEQLIVHLPTPLRDEIKEAAASESRSLSGMARRIIERWSSEKHEGAAGAAA